MAAAAARYDRPSIFRDAWARARQAAAAAAESVRLHIGAGMRAAWACAKAALGAPAKPAAPVVPVQLDLIEFIASLPPVVAAPVAPAAPASPRRFEHDGYVTAYTRLNADGEYLVDVYSRQPGSDVLIGQVEVYPIDFSGADAVLREALRAIEEARQAMATPVVQQPEPQETEESRLTARLAEMERERDELRADFLAARRERMAIVAGDMEGDAGIAWTNEDRAQADYDEAVERYEEAYQDLWRFTDIAA
ncbi:MULTISPECIES: hypothetical protein [unclassified Methylobacterium]|jgi:hypothetical protein|uniref:hypothetical protein n=1 Tax=unclassified Methylobacterium TaxID=2615210 RepID=UPI0006B02610|nr:hypothetical protein ADL19_04205 [Streptomyces purpurogeneiscleroticus]